ncbi:hypothetical protein I3760_03G038000 [Carya illinoinensis]|nr:hypothetical protein I3760_03G038000 [Carya illinoinensis]
MEKKPSRKRKRAKRLKSQNKKLRHEKDDSVAVEDVDERQEEEKEEPSASAFAKRTKSQGFSKSSTFLNKYHAGYQEQMSHWPEQPVNIIIKWLKDSSPSLVVADFGCGDARLAKNVKNKVFSLDLVSNDPSVIACDMSKTPLDTSVIDVAVFCLSLMGTNFASYLKEAHRVLKPGGWLLIAEVKSRFDPNTGGADPKKFSKAVCELGFTSELKDFSNKMFILLYFKKKDKQNPNRKEIEWPELKPCLYKRR